MPRPSDIPQARAVLVCFAILGGASILAWAVASDTSFRSLSAITLRIAVCTAAVTGVILAGDAYGTWFPRDPKRHRRQIALSAGDWYLRGLRAAFLVSVALAILAHELSRLL